MSGRRTLLLFLGVLLALPAAAQDEVAWWRLEARRGTKVADELRKGNDVLRGNWWKYVPGVAGDALRFDGFSTHLTRAAADAPSLGAAFTIDAWVALGAYPWNWCPIVDRSADGERGFAFGIEPDGRLGFRARYGDDWLAITGEEPLALGGWYHVAVVADEGVAALYVDGEMVRFAMAEGTIVHAPELDLLLGRDRVRRTPSDPVRTWATFPSWYSLDGILDEVRIHGRALPAQEILALVRALPAPGSPALPARRFPTVPASGEFGACYADLSYYDAWDALWRTGDHPDVVVQFDASPVKMMFWRGTRFSPCWVTENGKWMADQSLETAMNWGRADGPTVGCCEHMSDTQCRSSHVRIIENHAARVVVHWRYALMDVQFRQPHTDAETGWADWGDEYYTIYPDGVAVRDVRYHTTPGKAAWAGWQETIFLSEPGTRPEDNCELDAVTLADLAGTSVTYSWADGLPEFDLDAFGPGGPVIQMTNLKAKWRPFMVLPRGSRPVVFGGEQRAEYSHFPWWNHWPVAQVISDGRYAIASDRAAHSSLFWGGPTKDVALYGMTPEPAAGQVALARSWISPPQVAILGGATCAGGDYDEAQRAWVFTTKEAGPELRVRVDATQDSPLLNPCFVIEGWGDGDAILGMGGEVVPHGPSCRVGHRHTLEGTDLVVWLETKRTAQVELTITPARKD